MGIKHVAGKKLIPRWLSCLKAFKASVWFPESIYGITMVAHGSPAGWSRSVAVMVSPRGPRSAAMALKTSIVWPSSWRVLRSSVWRLHLLPHSNHFAVHAAHDAQHLRLGNPFLIYSGKIRRCNNDSTHLTADWNDVHWAIALRLSEGNILASFER